MHRLPLTGNTRATMIAVEEDAAMWFLGRLLNTGILIYALSPVAFAQTSGDTIVFDGKTYHRAERGMC